MLNIVKLFIFQLLFMEYVRQVKTYIIPFKDKKINNYDKFIQEITVINNFDKLINGMVNHLTNDENNVNCIAIICDNIYLDVFHGGWYKKIKLLPLFMMLVGDSEDLFSPNFNTLESIRQTRKYGCRAYIILIANGLQVSRFLKFGDRYRLIDTRAKYIILHDLRLFSSDLHYIWKRIINVIFIRLHEEHKNNKSWFELSTVPFPSPTSQVLVPRRVQIWKTNERFRPSLLFRNKNLDLKGQLLQMVAFQHIPATVKINGKIMLPNKAFRGMEIEIMQALSTMMNFKTNVYEPKNGDVEKWGRKQLNGSYSGLLGEMVNRKADVALGNLHYTPYNLQFTDLTIPYITECLTFLTPESLTDNSWKTLILPFKLYMWIAVLLVLLMSGFIFFSLAKFHKHINYQQNVVNETKNKPSQDLKIKVKPFNVKMEFVKKQNKSKKQEGLYLFEELSNSILYTYGMLLVVSLPKLPPGWSIRLLTGWYWLYCVLVVVSYRASMTAILANPAPRVTIDTLQELVESSIACGGWDDQSKEFFTSALDETGQEIGSKFENVNDIKKGVLKVTRGELAYYDNIYFLKYLNAKQKEKNKSTKSNQMSNTTLLNNSTGDRNLHVMRDCAIQMPVSIGLQKNSPLKPRIDKLVRYIIEAGLVEKWLNDVMVPIYSVISSDEENIKAVMNLKKLYGGFVAIGIGYLLSFVVLIGEIIHWNYIVKRNPNFDIYALHVY